MPPRLIPDRLLIINITKPNPFHTHGFQLLNLFLPAYERRNLIPRSTCWVFEKRGQDRAAAVIFLVFGTGNAETQALGWGVGLHVAGGPDKKDFCFLGHDLGWLDEIVI
jgi:hypothetical protein